MSQRTIGQIIRERRLELGLTQEDLAERISTDGEWLNQGDISRIETGMVKLPRPERLGLIAAALDLSLGDLLSHASGVDDAGEVLVDPPAEWELDAITAEAPSKPRGGASRPHLRFLDGIEQAVIVTDPDGTIRHWNRHAERLYGWEADEVIGRAIDDVTVAEPWNWQEQAEAIMGQLAVGKRWSGASLVRRRDGSTFTAHIALSPILDPHGTVVAILGVSHEVSECGEPATD